jgi:pimeloyl-ACP methyl ester carboxylesterase
MTYAPRMPWVVRGLLGVVFLVLAAVAVLVGGSLLSLDWERGHTAATLALPLASPSGPDGLARIEANGMTFRARVANLGGEGPGVILLHGFPETSAMWEPLFEVLRASGRPVVAFDQRGYSPGARPDGVGAYVVPELVGDVVAVADAVGFEKFDLVGHDWGCVVGWGVVIQHPERVLSWSGLSIPHPGALLADLVGELPTYVRVFTAPYVPELFFTWNGLALMRAGNETLPAARQAEYLAVFSEPGAMNATFNWYRGITVGLAGDTAAIAGPVEVPTLFLYGSGEGWVTDVALERQRKLVTGAYREIEVEAGHFVLRETPDAVIEAVLANIGSAGEAR